MKIMEIKSFIFLSLLFWGVLEICACHQPSPCRRMLFNNLQLNVNSDPRPAPSITSSVLSRSVCPGRYKGYLNTVRCQVSAIILSQGSADWEQELHCDCINCYKNICSYVALNCTILTSMDL